MSALRRLIDFLRPVPLCPHCKLCEGEAIARTGLQFQDSTMATKAEPKLHNGRLA